MASRSSLLQLDHDVLFEILSFLTAPDLDLGLSLACKSLSEETKSPKLWKFFCEQTGKLQGIKSNDETKEENPSDLDQYYYYFDLYHRVPCVPTDFGSIQRAVDVSPPGSTIMLLPGVYEERLVLDRSVRIRAVDPVKGAAIVWHDQSLESCDASVDSDRSLVEVLESCAYAVLQNLRLFHFSPGTDIWKGNCVLYCHGNLTHTSVHKCSIQSDSGRGVVVANGASVKLSRSTIHDCAATGLYVGEGDSIVEVYRSNILRNGFGGRRPLHERGNEEEEGDEFQAESTTLVDSGHSGLYVEGAEAEIINSLVAENCLTGLSVVQDGTLHICESDVVGNGVEPILLFQDPETADSPEGGVYEHSNHYDYGMPGREEMETRMIRNPHVYHRPFSKQQLCQLYSV